MLLKMALYAPELFLLTGWRMLYFNSKGVSKIRRFSNHHHPSFKFFPQSGAMAGQAHHSWAGAVSDNPFYAMPYAPAGETHVINKENNNEKQTIHY